jgi:hypothetical protein
MSEVNEERLSATAQLVLNNEAFKAAIANIQTKYTEQFKKSAVGDKEVREQAYLKLRALDDLLIELEALLNSAAVTTFNRSLQRRKS